MNKKRAQFTLLLSAFVLAFLSIFSWLKPETIYSDSERRALASMPEISVSSVLSGKFTSGFETYTQDQFPLRDWFRSLKAKTAFHLFQKNDNNDIVIQDNMIFKLEYPLNRTMLDHAANKFQSIYDRYLRETQTNVYFSIIPDKNYYFDGSEKLLKLDYEELFQIMKDKTESFQYIDISDLLELDDFYRTDTHWRQEKLLDVREKLLSSMNASSSAEYTAVSLDTPFYGVYHGQSAMNIEPDSLQYLTNKTLENCIVTSYNTGSAVSIPMIDLKKAQGKDAYEMFLNGADALITIENPDADNQRELIIFRDSFGSSLAPLFVESYSKITLIDIRYIQSSMIGNLIAFDQQDVLFLYSTLLLNNSLSLK